MGNDLGPHLAPRFRYLRDPLFLACLIGYFVNRLLIRPHVHGGFFHNSFNDLICIPFWIPIMLWAMRRLRLRRHDEPPTWIEIVLPVAIWSFVFEVWLPRASWLPKPTVGDPADILAYASGALVSMVFWDWWYGRKRRQEPTAAQPFTAD